MNPDELESLGVVFHAPATEAQLQELEKALGSPLPQDVRALYLHHDGMRERGDLPFRLLTTNEAAKTFRALRKEAPLPDEVRVFWTDDESNYAGLYVTGLAVGRVCVIDHEEPDATPVFRSIDAFYRALVSAGEEGKDAYELLEAPGDFLPEVTPSEQAADLALAEQYAEQYAAEAAPDRRQLLAFAAMQLMPNSESHRLTDWLRSEDMWVQERACTLLGRRGYTAAIPALAEVARTGKHNGRVAALTALRDFGAPAREEVARLKKELEPQWHAYLKKR